MTTTEPVQRNRLTSGGLIDRSRPLAFSFDGRVHEGYAGDTLASALLANGVRIVSRSFKFHRPRGIFAAGVEEPNAVVSLRSGSVFEPTVRATEIELTEGIQARSLRGWPSVGFDLGAAAQLAGPALAAGFYYKTFLAPSWPLYEKSIRRAAASACLSGRADGARYDSVTLAVDVAVIGGGPAGMQAAATIAAAGVSCALIESQARLGGRLLWSTLGEDTASGQHEAAVIADRLALEPNLHILTHTTAIGLYDGPECLAIETRRGDSVASGASFRLWRIRARRVILASGALERPLPFAQNDRPGIMLSDAIARYLVQYAVAPGRRLAVFTDSDAAYRLARIWREAGLEVAAVIDRRPLDATDSHALAGTLDVPLLVASGIVGTSGYRGLRAITVAERGSGRRKQIACDLLGISGGQTPLIQLACHRGARPLLDESGRLVRVEALADDTLLAGTVAGVKDSSADGQKAGEVTLETLRCGRRRAGARRAGDPQQPTASSPGAASSPRLERPERTWIDLQNDVKASDILLAAREGFTAVEHMKRYTTTGMAMDQGRTSAVNAVAILGAASGQSACNIGTTTHRPPFVGARLGALAGLQRGLLYASQRLLPAHQCHRDAGAVFDEFGGWLRPDHYAAHGEPRESAVSREMASVRGSVGLFDASPLGKIEVFGPDAAEFVDRFHVADLVKLRPGRVRYSVMLDDRGIVFDDGVVARLAEDRYLLGTTSANAERVAEWLERWHQCEWPGLRVAIEPVTTAWSTVAVAGPRARALLWELDGRLLLEPASLPHMTLRSASLAGISARIARVSFTGELQFEVSVPTRYGSALWNRLLGLGRSVGAQPVGMEAWLRLRLEKGYLHVGTDTDSRTTPLDIGMAPIVAAYERDFIGRRSLSLAEHRRSGREQLVGLRATGDGPLHVGARILRQPGDRPPCLTDGHVTSACFSPAAKGWIGLALLRDGYSRFGDVVETVHLDQKTQASVCRPPFYDPTGGRMRG